MMRPPMQKTALHQNEANRLQHHQQQSQLQQPQSETVHLIPHKHLQHQQQQQQQLQTTTTALTPTIASNNIGDDGDTLITATTEAAHKSQKLEQHELLVENHLNNACFAQVQHSAATTLPPLAPQPHLQHKIKEINPAHSILQQHQQQQLASCLEPFAVQQPSAVFYNEFYQHQQHSLHQQQRPRLIHRGGNIDDNLSSVKLLDLSTSPPGREDSHTSVFRTPALECREVFHNHQTPSNNSVNSQRFSYTSQYSRSSSSDDSSSLSLSTACGNIGAGSVLAGGGFTNFASGSAREHHSNNSTVYNTDSTAYSSYSNTFDDAAENFIINFPADTTPTQPLPPHYAGRVGTSKTTSTNTNSPHPSDFPHQQQAHNYCLPLSETEPLLTNIEATVKDRQRAIYLNKNSASLIFTKKDLSQTAATYQQQQQQFRLQSKTNNNFNGGSVSTTSSSSNTLSSSSFTSSSSHSNTNASVRRSLPHSTTLRSFSEENYSTRRKPTKHLPATYHQQHRRSLQLNYNNNLVTTSTCGSIANNNHQHQHCCNIPSGCSNKGSNTNSAVLHKPHHNNHSYQQQQQQQTKLQQQQQQSSGYTTTSCTSNNTATATRKQYAYSWYAPVYSALEEELEHDSRDSSPIHNLATTKKSNIQQYHRHHDLNTSSLTAPAADTDNEREALLESRNNINIQTHLPSGNHKRGGVGGVGGGGGGGGDHLIKQLNPSKLALQHTRNSSVKGGLHTAKGISLNGGGAGGVSVGSGGDIAAVEGFPNYDLEGPHAGSLGLAGGPQPRRIRFGNFLKSLVGLRPSVVQRTNGTESGVAPPTAANAMGGETESVQIPSSPEITITRTPSEQNMVVLRDPSGRQDYNVVYSSREKLANFNGDRSLQTGSTSSLNVMQQKLWNIMRREGSAISLHQEKSQSIVHYTGLRKCETVIALTRQTTSPCSPTLSVGVAAGGSANKSQQRLSHTGSGIFSASGVEQIRPLNRLRNSVSSMNNTCSRCSSLLSLAASTSRFSLSNGALANQNPHHTHQHQHHSQQLQHQQQAPPYSQHQYQHHQHQRYPSNVSSSNISSIYSHSRDGSLEAGLHFAVKRNSRTSFSSAGIAAAVGGCQRNSNSTSASSRTPSLTSPTATNASTIKLTTPPIPPPPTENSSPPPAHPAVSTLTLALPVTAAAPYPVPTSSRVEDIRFLPGPIETTTLSTPLTLTSLMNMPTASASKAETLTKIEHPDKDENGDVIDGVSNNNSGSSSAKALSAPTYGTPSTSVNALVVTAATSATALAASSATASASASSPESIIASILHGSGATTNTNLATSAVPSRPFELFTCKLCLIDVEDASNSTVLHQCGCQFCTECMKAYVEFEISEGAYEISCPDAQCPEQGAMILPEIAILTTTNLMKKHHRYRLNREIELDKTRTWCPRAGCETVCLIGTTSIQSGDGNPSASTSAAAAATTTPTANVAATLSPSLVGVGVGIGTGTGIDGNIIPTPVQCAVQCPSCKDEFCSACKKTWHPNITCEEHSRRLAADGQDDIGIPFDNDLIKCCPMCAVPIEKDEGCAQMMCKRCKHVFCWYCLASLDDDFLLRHYDKGPCKNKLGHSRASVVWHRAQVIGIFAGFGILLLVASPLLLLAAPCIICCKCRSCSGSKIDEGDGDMDEATALQSLN